MGVLISCVLISCAKFDIFYLAPFLTPFPISLCLGNAPHGSFQSVLGGVDFAVMPGLRVAVRFEDGDDNSRSGWAKKILKT